MREENKQKVEQFELFVCMVNECLENERPLTIAIEHDKGCHCLFTIVPDSFDVNDDLGVYLEGDGNIFSFNKTESVFYSEEEDEFVFRNKDVTYIFASTSPCAL